ncbi:DUF4126 family protein [Pedobacter immunditicola]|uniref:DUF4126 family protein n=1 Tax=Pedobacter immunditicola TaxID=3133440 RepID=UPI00309EC975
MKHKYLYQAIATGWLAGMRSVSALAISANLASHAGFFKPKTPLIRFLKKPAVQITSYILAAGEMVGDKLPATPDRIKPVPLTGRALMGALSGAVIYSLARRNPVTGALIASTVAVASTYTMYYLRKKIKATTNAPDLALGLAEDAIVISQIIRTKKG